MLIEPEDDRELFVETADEIYLEPEPETYEPEYEDEQSYVVHHNELEDFLL